MATKIEVTRNQPGTIKKKPSYLIELEEKWKTWTGIDDKEADEAIRYLSSDLNTEIRKFESIIYSHIESSGILESDKQKELINFIKIKIREMWRDMVEKQKIGIDKIGILVHKRLSINNLSEKNHGKKKENGKKEKKDNV